jgi:hypothetical protein
MVVVVAVVLVGTELTSGSKPLLVDDLGCVLLPTLAMHTALHNAEGTPAVTVERYPLLTTANE